jgi:hypothetical protein
MDMQRTDIMRDERENAKENHTRAKRNGYTQADKKTTKTPFKYLSM